MKLTKFNFSTLIFSALLTFNVNAGMCTSSNNDEIDNLIEQQKSMDPVETEGVFTESEYISTVEENINSVALDTSGILEETVMDAAMVTAEEAASALGVIGLVVLVGMAIYNIERAFANPDSTITEKVSSLVLGINPIATLVVSIGNDFGPSPYGKVRNKIDDALTDVAEQYSYTISKTEAAHLELFTSMVEKTLINAINNTAVIKKTYANYSKILLRNYAEEYLVGVKKMHDNLSKIYAKQWMKASPYFIALNTTLDNAVKGEEIAPPKIISSQTLTLCGVDDDHYFLNFKGKNSRQIKRCLEGVFYDYKAHFKDYTLYDEITISAPDLEQKPPVEITQNMMLNKLLTSYAKTYNHFLSNIRITFVNNLYKEQGKINKIICLKQKSSGENLLKNAKSKVWDLAENIFRAENHIDKSGKSTTTNCWSGSEYLCKVTLHYIKDKDVSVPLVFAKIDALQVLIDDSYQNCLKEEYYGSNLDSPHELFVNALNTDRFFPMLNIENTPKFFSDIFKSVKSVLLFSVKQKLKIAYENKKK
jgi:hypothetical protein